MTEQQTCLQLALDSQSEVIKEALYILWVCSEAGPDSPDPFSCYAWNKHRDFLQLLADNHDFLKPLFASLARCELSYIMQGSLGAVVNPDSYDVKHLRLELEVVEQLVEEMLADA